MSAQEKMRQECIRELIVTEQAYVKDMALVKEVRFFLDLTTRASDFQSTITTCHLCSRQVFEKPLSRAKVLTDMECMEVFVNWDDLYHCNNKLLRSVRSSLIFSMIKVLIQLLKQSLSLFFD
jgi:hypothetical protein